MIYRRIFCFDRETEIQCIGQRRGFHSLKTITIYATIDKQASNIYIYIYIYLFSQEINHSSHCIAILGIHIDGVYINSDNRPQHWPCMVQLPHPYSQGTRFESNIGYTDLLMDNCSKACRRVDSVRAWQYIYIYIYIYVCVCVCDKYKPS